MSPYSLTRLVLCIYVESSAVVVVNGQQNQMILKFINSGTGNYTIVNAAASYHDVEKNWALVRVSCTCLS